MIAEIGHYALALALILSALQASVPLIGAQRGDAAWMAVGTPAAQAQFVLVAISFAALTYGFVVSDFSVYAVAAHSHSAKPLIYKITGVWANHEGSMLLWILILVLFGALVATLGRNIPPPLKARVLSVQGMISLGFIAFILFTSNPFTRLDFPPPDGQGMNPLLQDPGIAIHPPFLYLGYVGFSIAFAFAVAALIEGRVDATWARWVRPWTLLAWLTLTAGIALGSWWAYYELGWGGWWFWDPVENASFMPWLLGTALLHSTAVVEKRDALKRWTVLLAILTFSLSLIGTFLVRSGVLTSVHAFANDPERGVFILLLLAVAIGGSLTLFAMRAHQLEGGGLFQAVSREGALLLNNLLLATATATVFLGTLYPLFVDVLGGSKVSVGPPFFNATFVPIMTPLIVAMAVGPLLPWKRGRLLEAAGRLKIAMAATGCAVLLTLVVAWDGPFWAALGMGLAAWLMAGTLTELAGRVKLFKAPLGDSLRRAWHLPRAAWGMTVAHAGMAVVVFGIVGISAWKVERILVAQPGVAVEVAGYDFTLIDVRQIQGPNYQARIATVSVSEDGDPIATLFPERRWYPVQRMATTEAGIHTMGISDIYVALGERDAEGGWVMRYYHNPTVPWIWYGSAIMVLGAIVSMFDRRLRVGAPRRARSAPSGAAPAPAE